MATANNGAPSGAPGRSRKAAQAETNGKLRKTRLKSAPVTGLELEDLPKQLPSTFSWDAARVQGRIASEDPRVIGDLYRLIESVIGEDNSERIRERLAAKKVDPGVNLLADVLNDITTLYGTDLGE